MLDSGKNCYIILNDDLEKVLIRKDQAKAEQRDAKKDQKIVSEFEAQAKVVEYGAEFWEKVNSFALQKKLGSPDAIIALKMAMRIPLKLPNIYQCQKLLELLIQAESEGFKA